MSQSLSFVPALAAGLVLGGAGGYLLAPDQASAADRALAPTQPDPSGRAAVPGSDIAPAPSALTGSAAPAESSDGTATPSPEARRVAAANTEVELAIAGGPWMTELSELLRSGRLESGLAALADQEDPERGAALALIEIHLRLSDPVAALDVLDRGPDLGHPKWAEVGRALLGSEDRELAARAFTQALDLLPDGATWGNPVSHYVESLAQVDPATALAYAERYITGEPTAEQNLTIARLLAQSGQGAAARERALEMIGTDQMLLPAIQILAEQDPEAAEAEIRRRLEAQGDDSGLQTELVKLMLAGGRQDEALAYLDEQAANGSQNTQLLLLALRELPDSVVGPRLDSWLEAAGDPAGAHHSVGAHFAGTDPTRAFDHYEQAFDSTFRSGGGWLRAIPDDVLLSDPGRALSMLAAGAAQAGTNDEIWGDIGDHYWRLGEHQRAEDAWRRAAEIDPNDGEWSSNLQDIALERPPVGNVGIPGAGRSQTFLSNGMSNSLQTFQMLDSLGY